MISVDTNVLLRYLLGDHPQQSTQARALIKGDETVLVTDIALVETIWTLQGKRYRLKKNDLISVIQALFAEPSIRFENNQAVWMALDCYRNAESVVDFPDTLIVYKSRQLIKKEQQQTFNGVYTFDKAAQDLPSAKALG